MSEYKLMLENRKKKKIKKNEDSLRDLWDNINHVNIYWESQKKRREKRLGGE